MRRPCRPAALVAGTQKRARKLGTRGGPPPGAVKTWLLGRLAAARCASSSRTTKGGSPTVRRPARVLGGPAISLPLTSVRTSATVTDPASRSIRLGRSPASSSIRRRAGHGQGDRPATLIPLNHHPAVPAGMYEVRSMPLLSSATQLGCWGERFLRRLRSAATWENGVEHSGSLCFADTEEVTGSNPVAPTNMTLTSGNAAGPFPSRGRRGEESTLPFGKRSTEVRSPVGWSAG
jgi:hypothetical protein